MAPADVTDAQVLAAVRTTWAPSAVSVRYLPVGFGAHHWRVGTEVDADLFVTLDDVRPPRDRAALDAAYRTAAELAEILAFVHAGAPPWTIEFEGDRALSVTPWVEGRTPDRLDRVVTTAILDALHGVPPPTETPPWVPSVGPDLPARLRADLSSPWAEGPFGARARGAISARLEAIADWVSEYRTLVEAASARTWVVTHGEPGVHNQLDVAGRLLLVDWESSRLAPAERDLRTLDVGDPGMLRLFDLEWRLDEITQYASWFRGVHSDGEDDRIAFAGLLEELEGS